MPTDFFTLRLWPRADPTARRCRLQRMGHLDARAAPREGCVGRHQPRRRPRSHRRPEPIGLLLEVAFDVHRSFLGAGAGAVMPTSYARGA